MPRPDRTRLVPWIENLILNYGGREEEEGGGGGRLKAHVIGVGQMSPSQARGPDDPTGLLFLSDGALQIPAVLTACAWERLQEQEDRECFSSLVNTTVFLQDYRLRFHMAPEQTRCRFFLSVGKLATTAAGPVKDSTPCCTTLPSVRMKICQMWRTLLGQEDRQGSQSGLDLSELLGEWQHDCLRDVLEDVRSRLKAASPQPSTASTHSPTGWDVDRVRYKAQRCFRVPVEVLCVPEDAFQHFPGNGTQPERGRESTSPRLPADGLHSPVSESAGAETVSDAGWSSPVQLEDVLVAGTSDGLLSNPWDKFPPPSVSCSPDSSPEPARHHGLAATMAMRTPDSASMATRATHTPNSAAMATRATRTPDSAAMATSPQPPLHSSKESSDFPPYQKQPSDLLPTSPTPSAPPEAPDRHQTTQQSLLALGTAQGSDRKPKRKRCEEEEEEELGGSPPSWLFHTQTGASWVSETSSPKRTGTVPRRSPGIHGDGRPFRYCYQVSGQNLQDFSRFRVAASQLHWAVRYLLAPRRTGGPPEVM